MITLCFGVVWLGFGLDAVYLCVLFAYFCFIYLAVHRLIVLLLTWVGFDVGWLTSFG